MKFSIQTFPLPNGNIHQKLFDEEMREVAHWIMETRDEAVQKALEELGWKPPSNDPDPIERIQALGEMLVECHTLLCDLRKASAGGHSYVTNVGLVQDIDKRLDDLILRITKLNPGHK